MIYFEDNRKKGIEYLAEVIKEFRYANKRIKEIEKIDEYKKNSTLVKEYKECITIQNKYKHNTIEKMEDYMKWLQTDYKNIIDKKMKEIKLNN